MGPASAMPTGSGRGSVPLRRCSLQSADELGLGRIELLPRRRRIEPGTAVHLGKRQPATRPSGPFGTHEVAGGSLWVGVAFPGPGVDELARLLLDAPQRQEGTPGRDAGLLLELATGRRQGILAFGQLAFGDGPGARIPM